MSRTTQKAFRVTTLLAVLLCAVLAIKASAAERPSDAAHRRPGVANFDASAELPRDEREFNHLYPGYRPGNGQVCDINPPLFSWMYYIPGKDRTNPRCEMVSGALVGMRTPLMRFRFQIAKDPQFKDLVLDKKDLWYPWYNTIAPLEGAEKWYWRVGYSERRSNESE